jgi:hypothetical protein
MKPQMECRGIALLFLEPWCYMGMNKIVCLRIYVLNGTDSAHVTCRCVCIFPYYEADECVCWPELNQTNIHLVCHQALRLLTQIEFIVRENMFLTTEGIQLQVTSQLLFSEVQSLKCIFVFFFY